MKTINDFKVGDIITRNEPVGSDSSYCGDRLILEGHDKESKIIFLRENTGDIIDLSYARDSWDKGWCLFPETMWEKIKGYVKPE